MRMIKGGLLVFSCLATALALADFRLTQIIIRCASFDDLRSLQVFVIHINKRKKKCFLRRRNYRGLS
jgi:hypothetical protein